MVDEGLLFRTNETAFVQTKRKLLDECDLYCIISLPGGVFTQAGAGRRDRRPRRAGAGPTGRDPAGRRGRRGVADRSRLRRHRPGGRGLRGSRRTAPGRLPPARQDLTDRGRDVGAGRIDPLEYLGQRVGGGQIDTGGDGGTVGDEDLAEVGTAAAIEIADKLGVNGGDGAPARDGTIIVVVGQEDAEVAGGVRSVEGLDLEGRS